jgi:hypothetical protein
MVRRVVVVVAAGAVVEGVVGVAAGAAVEVVVVGRVARAGGGLPALLVEPPSGETAWAWASDVVSSSATRVERIRILRSPLS